MERCSGAADDDEAADVVDDDDGIVGTVPHRPNGRNHFTGVIFVCRFVCLFCFFSVFFCIHDV